MSFKDILASFMTKRSSPYSPSYNKFDSTAFESVERLARINLVNKEQVKVGGRLIKNSKNKLEENHQHPNKFEEVFEDNKENNDPFINKNTNNKVVAFSLSMNANIIENVSSGRSPSNRKRSPTKFFGMDDESSPLAPPTKQKIKSILKDGQSKTKVKTAGNILSKSTVLCRRFRSIQKDAPRSN